MNTAAISAPRTHPYLRGDPLPASAQQPGLSATIRYFTVTREKLISDYPYEISPSPSAKSHIDVFRIPYCEISGRGPPPADLTGSHLGDIYIDLSPERYAAYGKVADGTWKRWYDPQPSHKTEEVIVKHPHLKHRLLWCSDATGISCKTEDTKWREASAIISVSLGEPEEQNNPIRRRSTSPLSPLVESRQPSPLPVLGKRKTRGQEERERSAICPEAKRYKALLQRSIQQLTDEKKALAKEICVLEKQQLDSSPHSDVVDPGRFSKWTEKVVLDGMKTCRKEMDPHVREYWDLNAELVADEEERSKEEGMLEDAQILLGQAISEHKQLKLLAASA
ncbi:hypothetical protein MVEN_02451800 [Mycena venus]|uniref:Uncharacterized protein n=1 Tax=Mycena venus TaxID=2733690 RepID=A0A8H6WYW6_9AGAR|nr:hypothetical protein MVEN_02451800 [Mycena venus]